MLNFISLYTELGVVILG